MNAQNPAREDAETDLLIHNSFWRRIALKALRAVDAAFAPQPDHAEFKGNRIAYLCNTHMGDVTVAVPYIAYFRSRFPSCEVVLFAHQAYAEMYEYFDVPVTCVPPLPLDTHSTRARVHDISAKLRSLSVDASINASSERYFAVHVAQRKAGIPVRVGWSHKGLGVLLTRPAVHDPAYRSHQRVGALFATLTGDDTFLDGTRIFDWWFRRHPPVQHSVPTHRIGLVFEAQHGFVWSAERWDGVIRSIAQDRPLTTFVMLGKDDSPVTSSVRTILGTQGLPFEDQIGRTSMGGLLDVLRGLDGVITVDTGVRHVANLLALPTVVMRHSQSSNVEWGPYGRRESVLTHPEPCSPCGLASCKHDTIRCMESITSSDIVNAVRSIIPGGRG